MELSDEMAEERIAELRKRRDDIEAEIAWLRRLYGDTVVDEAIREFEREEA